MSENFTTGIPNLETPISNLDSGICFGPKAFPASSAAMELRLMMKKADGEDKCTLCRAAQELEKSVLKPNSGNWNISPSLLILMLSVLWGDDFTIDPDGMKAYMDAVDKKQKENVKEKEN